MNLINPNLLLDLAQVGLNDPVAWVPLIWCGYQQGRWTEDDIAAWDRLSIGDKRRAIKGHLGTLPTPSPECPRDRRPSRKRDARLRKRRVTPGARYVRRHALDPFIDARLNNGARTTLTYVIARCGKSRTWSAPTCWVAEDLGCSNRSIQRHYAALQAAGYLIRSAPDKRGRTTVYLTPQCEPPDCKKRRENDAISAAESATKMSPTQPMKGDQGKEKEGTTGIACATSATRADDRPDDPGAALTQPAPPPDRPTVGGHPQPAAPLAQPMRLGDPAQEASEDEDAEPTSLGAALSRFGLAVAAREGVQDGRQAPAAATAPGEPSTPPAAVLGDPIAALVASMRDRPPMTVSRTLLATMRRPLRGHG